MAEHHLLLEVFSTPPRTSSFPSSSSHRRNGYKSRGGGHLRATQSQPSSPGVLNESSQIKGSEAPDLRRENRADMLFSVEELALATWDSPFLAAIVTPTRQASTSERRKTHVSSVRPRTLPQSSGDGASHESPPQSSLDTKYGHDSLTAESSTSSTPERDNRMATSPGKMRTALVPSRADGGASLGVTIAPRPSGPSGSSALGNTFVNRFGGLSANYVSPATSRDESASSLSRAGSQNDELSDDGQDVNLQELVRELRYDEGSYRHSNVQLPESISEEKKEVDWDEALKQPWFIHCDQQQPVQPDPPEEIPPTPSEIGSSVVSTLSYVPRAPDPPPGLQREHSATGSSAQSARSTMSTPLKNLESPFAFMMSRSAEDILNVTAEESDIVHCVSTETKLLGNQNHLQTPKTPIEDLTDEDTPALLSRPPQAASPGPSPLSSFPSLYHRINRTVLSPNRKSTQLPPVGRIATPPPPPPGPPPRQHVKSQVTQQQPLNQVGTPPRQHGPATPPRNALPLPPASSPSVRLDSVVTAGTSIAVRAVTPIMRIRLGIEEPTPHPAVDVPEEAKTAGTSDERGRVVSPTGTMQTEATNYTEGTDNHTSASLEESESHQKQRRMRKKKKKRMADGIRRKLARGHGRRRGTNSSRSAASSTLGRSNDDDDTYYSSADLSCQELLSRLIQSRCGTLEDSASLYEDSESDDDENYDESEASTLFSDRQKKDGRIVSFDDESDDRDARQQKVLMLKQKKQLKPRAEENEVSLDVLKQEKADRTATSAGKDNDKPERQSVVSEGSSKQASSGAIGSNQEKFGRDWLEVGSAQSSYRTRHSETGEEGSREEEWGKAEFASKGPPGSRDALSHAFERGSTSAEEVEKVLGNISASESSQSGDSQGSLGSRTSPQDDNNNAFWHGVDQTRSREIVGVLDQKWNVYGDSEMIEPETTEFESQPESQVQEVIRRIAKSTATVSNALNLNEVDVHDRNFIKTFVSLATTTGFPLLHHRPAKKLVALPAPAEVTVHVRFGVESPSGEYAEPQMAWSSSDGVPRGVIELFDIDSLDRASSSDLRAYPMALPSKSIILRTESGDTHVFEAMDEGVAYRFVHGMRWIVARLSFNLIIGNLNVSCELLDTYGDDSDIPEALKKQMLMKAMNDATNHLVNKSVTK